MVKSEDLPTVLSAVSSGKSKEGNLLISPLDASTKNIVIPFPHATC